MSKKPKAVLLKRPAENLSSNLKKSAWSAIFESTMLIILGILFVVWPDTMVRVIAYIIGVLLILKGIFDIATYFYNKGQFDFSNNNLIYGAVIVIIGIVSIIAGENIAQVFRIIIGIIIIYESLVRIGTATRMSSAGVSAWKYVLILAIIMLALGIFVTFNNGAIVAVVGWLMILTGAIGIAGDVVFIQHINTVMDKLTGTKKGSTTSGK
ncbi:DUF308 domain-containing protein [Candidatus Saccharibacteria bacterium]|nr:DUF308 domain-containing protein [Candidatus Saccharibacteria bacterium]